MKKLTLSLLLLLASHTAEARDWYFSSSTGNNSNSCTIGSPCLDFNNKGLDASGALSAGDFVYFKRGDEWNGSLAEVVSDSAGTGSAGVPTNPITFDAYGSGDAPLFNGSGVPTTTWTLHSGEIWKKTLASSATVMVVGVDKETALGVWWGSNTTVPRGHFQDNYANPATIYVRLWDGSDPNGHDMYVPTAVPHGDGNRGMIRTTKNAHYNIFKNLKVIYANSGGIESSSTGSQFYNIEVMGAAKDGARSWSFSNASYLERGEYTRFVDCTVTYSAANGSGNGQAFTLSAAYSHIIRGTAYNNFMAGMDILYNPSVNYDVKECTIVLSEAYNNGIWEGYPSFDPNMYVDGAHDVVVHSSKFYKGGVGSGNAGAARSSIAIGSEHPTTAPTYNIDFINLLAYGSHWEAHAFGEICYGSVTECPSDGSTKPRNLDNINFIGCTLAAISDSSTDFDITFQTDDLSANADAFTMKNCILIGQSGDAINPYMPAATGTNLDRFDFDNNIYWRRDDGTTIFVTSGTSRTLSGWQSVSGEDASSLNTNPRILTDSDTAMDAHLWHTATGQASNSPGINAGVAHGWTPPAWVPDDIADLMPTEAEGSTRTDDVLDTGAIDIGYHYSVPPPVGPGSITSATVIPASYISSAAGNLVIDGEGDHDWPVDGTLIISFGTDAGSWTFSSGGATAASFTSGGSGSLSVATGSNSITLTRSAGSIITAGTAWEITLTNIQNPSGTGPTNFFGLNIRDSLDADIDINLVVPSVTIIPNPGETPHFSCTSTFTGKGFTIQ